MNKKLYKIQNKADALQLYEETNETPAKGVEAVVKALITDANQTENKGSLRETALYAYHRANDIFVAFAGLLLKKHSVFVSKHHFMAMVKQRAPILFNYLKTSGLKPAKDYEKWSQ